jgi:preprotein translocase subunit YajC
MSLFGLIPDAVAQTAAPATQGVADLLQQFAPFVLIIGIFYFLLIRPQQQKQKQLRNQLAELRRGDSVITSGGIIGTVARVINDDELSIEIAEGVRVRVIRSTLTGITAKGEPRPDAKDGDAEPVTLKPVAGRRGRIAPANESKPQA